MPTDGAVSPFFVMGVLLCSSCQNPELDTPTYFERRIAPILLENCVSGTANNKCHVEGTDAAGNPIGQAMGNLDLSSFEAVRSRPELLSPYGSYPDPVLLLKGVKPEDMVIPYQGSSSQSEVFHAGGGILSRNTAAFVELEEWLDNGATEDGRPPKVEDLEGVGDCSTALRPDVKPYLDDAAGSTYETFKSKIQPVLRDRCGFSNCHGTPQSDFFITCGGSEDQLRQDFVVTRSFVSAEVTRSELLLRPLAPEAGGQGHSGGSTWLTADDAEFAALREWAKDAGPFEVTDASAGFQYFADEVMPAMLRRGCLMPQCHSPHGFNEYRLRAGSLGFFSSLTLRRNYEETFEKFVNLDSSNPNNSRILAKNVAASRGGITHRAGITLLEARDDGGDPSLCDAQAQSDEGLSAYCTIVAWIRLERQLLIDEGELTTQGEGDTAPLLYVERPANPDRRIDFAEFRGASRLMVLDASFDANGRLGGFGTPAEIDLSACATFDSSELDVRAPEVSYDTNKMVFALRAGEDDGLNVYIANLDGTECEALTSDGGETADGVPVHNFDPVFIPHHPDYNPDGSIVYASTRAGKLGRANVSPKYRLPASNIWRMKLDGSEPEQMTFLNGSELSPAMMQSGKLIMTTEKATEGIYQLSGRRINWDLTDYHPLLAQRGTIGYRQATDIREGLDYNFLIILSDEGAWFSGGALATFNRSVGPFEHGRDDAGFLHSLEFPDPDAEGAGQGTARGAFRSPYPAPDGRILVSYAPGSIDLTDKGADVDYGLALVDPVDGSIEEITGMADGLFQVDAVVVSARREHKVFKNGPHLVFGGAQIPEEGDRAWAHFLDLPMLATLLTENIRRGRDLDTMIEGDTLAVYAAKPPPVGDMADGDIFQDWQLAGTVALEADGSAFVSAPAATPIIVELRKGNKPILTMTEEHQFGPGEMISLGVKRDVFDGVCGGCHGSTSGRELDVVVKADALTSASVSMARPDPGMSPKDNLQ